MSSLVWSGVAVVCAVLAASGLAAALGIWVFGSPDDAEFTQGSNVVVWLAVALAVAGAVGGDVAHRRAAEDRKRDSWHRELAGANGVDRCPDQSVR
ncbi:MAG: hypothetical protein ABI586_07230 [Candidatus Nanopelagicales bacterium]